LFSEPGQQSLETSEGCIDMQMLRKCSWAWWLFGCFSMNDLSSYSCPQPGECSQTDRATQMGTPRSELDPSPPENTMVQPEPRETAGSSEQQSPEIEVLTPRVEPTDEGAGLAPAPAGDLDTTVPAVDGAALPAPVDAGPAPNPECLLAFGESCYRVSTGPAAWLDAERDCEVDGGRLATIDSQEEDEFVGSLLPFSIWLGSISAASPFLLWADGSPITFSHWAPTEPTLLGPLDCIEKRQIEGEPWFDEPCFTGTVWYVCERALVAIE
jgi:hypothetical protein